MNNKPFDPTKPVQTRDGRAARIVSTDRHSLSGYSIVALVDDRHGTESNNSYQPDGHYLLDDVEDCRDLLNVPVRVNRAYWLNLYEDYGFGSVHMSRNNADAAARPGRIACVPVTVDCEEGTGL